MTWPIPAPPVHPLRDALALGELDGPSVASLAVQLGSLPGEPGDSEAINLETIGGWLSRLDDFAATLTPAIVGRLSRVVLSSVERVIPWLELRRSQRLHRRVVGGMAGVRVQGRGVDLRVSRVGPWRQADPLEELAALLVDLELAGHWRLSATVHGAWLATENDARAPLLVPILQVLAVIRRLAQASPSELSLGSQSVLARYAWGLLCAPARRPRVVLLTGAEAPLRSTIGHSLVSRLRGAALLRAEGGVRDETGHSPDAWLDELAGALSDLQIVVLCAPVRPPTLNGHLRRLAARCDEFALVRNASAFPLAIPPGVRRFEAEFPEELLASAILATLR